MMFIEETIIPALFIKRRFSKKHKSIFQLKMRIIKLVTVKMTLNIQQQAESLVINLIYLFNYFSYVI